MHLKQSISLFRRGFRSSAFKRQNIATLDHIWSYDGGWLPYGQRLRKVKRPELLENELETILVVDDDPIILKIVISTLKRANFKILSINCAETALKLAERKEDRINLRLSDVEVPDLSGPDLGEALKKSRPDVHVMFMSGGSTGNLLVLNYGWVYIQKPFVPIKLDEMIYEVMHSPNRSQLGGQEFDSRRDQR